MALDYGTHSYRSHRKLEESASPFRSVEITSPGSLPYSRHSRKDMAGGSPLGSPVTARRTEPNGLMDPVMRDQLLTQQMLRTSPASYAIQQQMLQLKKQQQLQQQILHEQFQAQKQQLAEQHEQQLRQHLKKLWEQKKIEEERERREQEKLEMLRKKDKHEQSAVASSEVKQKLQGFLLNKQAAKAANAAAAANGVRGGSPNSNSQQASQASSVASSTGFRNWTSMQPPAPQAENPAPQPSGPSPYPRPQALLGKYDDDVPLRRTASEPNLKVRLKQRVIDRRNSPLIRRKDRLLKRKSQLAMDACNSPESGPNSPPTSAAAVIAVQSARGNTPIQEEAGSPYAPLANSQGSMNDLSQLYSSPSMPNISLGRPHVASGSSPVGGQQEQGIKISPQTEAEVRAAYAARYGLPLTGQMLQNSLPFYPTLPVIDGDYSNPSSPSYIQKQMQALEQAQHQNLITAMYHSGPITDTQVAHAHLNKGVRPLGRTKSAPLPLGHPMLQGSHPGNLTMPSANYQEYLQEKQMYDQQQQHNLLKQHIRKTVLTRASGRNASAQLDEAVEVDDSAEETFLDISSDSSSSPPLVIDLTDRKSEEDLAAKQHRERELFIQQQQRDLLMRQNFTLQISEGSAFTPRAGHMVRPLSRALSSPLVALVPQQQAEVMASSMQAGKPGTATALAYDGLMLKHQCICGDNSSHPEHSGRLQSIWARLAETGLLSRCLRYRARKATLEEIQSCHSEAHALLFGTSPQNRQKLDVSKLSPLPIKSFVRLPCGGIGVDSDTTWNELHTSSAACMAVGCVVDLATKSASGEIKNGFAVVRPPGHHAEPSQAMGFCFFNSIAIAARQLQQRFDMERILILDWDVHHGNGTQQIFYNDPHVLYLSIHRHDDGNFFPGTGGPSECGIDDGMGFNVNVAWSGGLNPPMSDAEYLAAFRTIVMPIAKDFDPEIVLVSAGFDACNGHAAPLGGYKVSAACFGYMTHQLLQLAGGKVILALEGGYDLPSICDAAQECVKALIGEETSPMSEEELCRPPNKNAIETLQNTIAIQNPHWPCIKKYAHTVSWSAIEASQKERDESETVTAMASLSMKQHSASTIQIASPPERRCTPMEEPMDQDEAK